jgi:predicted CoA-binding protein
VILTTAAQRRALLERIRSIAVIGASGNPLRPSYTVFSYLRTQTKYDVTPVNPTISEIDGIPAVPSLADYAQRHGGAPDLIDVFRRPAELLGIVREAIAIRAPAIWFQYGVVDEGAIELADRNGLTVVVDRCIKVEYARFNGGLATSGLNSGLITSRRRT